MDETYKWLSPQHKKRLRRNYLLFNVSVCVFGSAVLSLLVHCLMFTNKVAMAAMASIIFIALFQFLEFLSRTNSLPVKKSNENEK